MGKGKRRWRGRGVAGKGDGVENPVGYSNQTAPPEQSNQHDWTALERRSDLCLTFYLGLSCPN